MANRSTNTNRGLNTRIDGRLFSYVRNSFVRGGGGTNFADFAATGGTILEPGNGYKYHVFTTSGSFVVQAGSRNVDYLVVGGGGPGGEQYNTTGGAGGGGAGGVRTNLPGSGYLVNTSSPYPVVVGGTGSQSTFDTITSEAGGKGGGMGPGATAAQPGGSGGGGGVELVPFSGATGNRVLNTSTPVPAQGNPGGNGQDFASPATGGGGGGAGAAGKNYNGSPPGAGGVGVSAFNGDTGLPASYGTPGPTAGRWFGGGGGALSYPGNTPSPGGAGGGGNGGVAATVNTGGGGGGGKLGADDNEFSLGASGIVILRYTS